MIQLAAMVIIAVPATPAAERPDLVLQAFVDALATEDKAASGRLAPEFVLMVTPISAFPAFIQR
jgi:hypothetical protein